MLLRELSSGKEEELVVIAARAWPRRRPAQLQGWIEERGLRSGQPVGLLLPVAGVEDMVARRQLSQAVKLAPAGLGLGGNNNRSIGFGDRVSRGLDLEFRDHVDVGRDGSRAGSVEIGDRRPIAHQIHQVEAVAVDRKGARVLRKAG